MPSQNQARNRPLVVIVDDDPDMVSLISRFLGYAGYAVEAFADAESCLAGFSRLMPDAVCLDLMLPGLGGLETLKRIKDLEPHLPVVILTADNAVDSAVRAMQEGAYDYLVKPIDRTKLVTTIKNAVERSRMSLRLVQLEREVEGRGYPGIIGDTPPMRELFRQMDRLAASDVSVLIHGESGTGKELVARALHTQSGRRRAAFVALNCAAIPETLQESELFGHERGAFTGALDRRIGRFEEANRGTLFLDEVAELSPALQAKLLRALQERAFRRVGGSVDVRSDFRLVAATHRNLSDEVAAGRFREDLFYRIAVFELAVPALRDRRDDIPLLASALLRQIADGRSVTVAPDALQCFRDYSWPGNVRELSNAIQRAWVASDGARITVADLPERVRDGSLIAAPPRETDGAGLGVGPDPIAPIRTLEDMERIAIQQALARHSGNLSEAGRQLGIGRTTLYRKLKQFGLR
jgi:DNA-binding NtrC family response regulator